MEEHERLDLTSLYARHAPFVRRTLARRGVSAADLDDLAQEAFVVANRLLPEFEGRSSVQTWLGAIAWRVARNYRKRSHRRHELAMETAPDLASGYTTGFEGARLRAWTTRDTELRDLLVLHDVGELSISQLSSLTGLARATIRKRLQHRGSSLDDRAQLPELQLERAPLWRSSEHTMELSDGANQQPVLRSLPRHRACFLAIDDLFLNVWYGVTSADGLRAVGETLESMAEAYPSGFRYMNVLGASSTIPDCDARQVNGELVRRFGSKITAATFVVDSSKTMQMIGPILNAYIALTRSALNFRVFSDVPKAMTWLGQYGPLDAGLVAGRVAAMRMHLDQTTAD